MKNQYMFFSEQLFDGFDLTGYVKADVCIPNTSVHIYEFACEDDDSSIDDEAKAKRLDTLSGRLAEAYPDAFQIINSESSQYFCGQIYPLIVSFETKLRHALYISRALFENGNVSKKSFQYTVAKTEKLIEEIDFGEIYDAIFTDKDLKPRLMKEYTLNLTKADLLKRIQEIEEVTLWRKIVGTGYGYIENHFLEIKDFRNDVMHNHLISGKRFDVARDVLQQANAELVRAISDKLIVNRSEYLNEVDIVGALKGMTAAFRTITASISQLWDADYSQNIAQALSLIGERMAQNSALMTGTNELVEDSGGNENQEEEDNA